MRLVATTRFRKDARLAVDIPADVGRAPLLRAGVRLSEHHRGLLLERGVLAIYVDDALGEDIEVLRAVSEEVRVQAREAFGRSLASVAGSGALPDHQVEQLRETAGAVAAEVAAAGDAALALADLAGSDAYTMEHSIDVTVVGLLIGRRLFSTRGRLDYRGRRDWDNVERHLVELGVGLFLHDIGKLAIPDEVLRKRGPLDEGEWGWMRRHPQLGFEMLQRSVTIGPRAKSVVLSHHERWDGKGYPSGLAGGQISQFARIGGVADVFDAVTSSRPYAQAAPQNVGVQVILEGSGTAFDPEVVEVFGEVIAPYPAGHEITLADGRIGVVTSVEPGRLDLPRVRVFADADGRPIPPREIDLADRPELAPRPARAA
jgi:HD-GYP domain-containing protein (c-di-GMP phosphodiesterase class II)